MSILGYLVTERPELRLRFVDPTHARICSNNRITELAVVALAQPSVSQSNSPAAGALALVALSGEINQHGTTALAQLLRHLKQCRASGLVLRAPGRTPSIPTVIRARAESLELPLLITTAGPQWAGVDADLQQQRALFAERQVEALDGLLHTLPNQLASPDAADRIVSWLSEALDADVLAYSADRGIFASSPDSSSDPARAVIFATPYTDRVEHSRRVQIHGTKDEAVLAVGSRRTFDEAAGRLIRHAAKVLGLLEQTPLDHHAAVLAPRSVSQAATQLLLAGHVVPGQAVANTIHPELMSTQEVIVRIIDTGAQEREPTLQLCERTLHDRALVSPCPGKDCQIIVITPNRVNDSVEADLRKVISSRSWLLMGESLPYPLEASGAGYAEASEAVRRAARSPERISVGAAPKFAPLLPRNEARAWAQALLAPLLDAPEHELILSTAPTGLSFKGADAAKGLGIHRNTLQNRLDRAASLLGLDLNQLNDRVLALLALNILALPAPPGGFRADRTPLLSELMTANADAVKEWAEHRLRVLESDPRDLLGTVHVWLEKSLSVRETSQALGLSAATVRTYTGDASLMLGMNATTKAVGVHDTDMVGIADIYIASYLLTGKPELKHVPAASCPALQKGRPKRSEDLRLAQGERPERGNRGPTAAAGRLGPRHQMDRADPGIASEDDQITRVAPHEDEAAGSAGERAIDHPAPGAALLPADVPHLPESLSKSELRVLRYLPTHLSMAEIAGELHVSLNTVRTHMRHLYAKLHTHRRAETVDRARVLGLLAPPPVGEP